MITPLLCVSTCAVPISIPTSIVTTLMQPVADCCRCTEILIMYHSHAIQALCAAHGARQALLIVVVALTSATMLLPPPDTAGRRHCLQIHICKAHTCDICSSYNGFATSNWQLLHYSCPKKTIHGYYPWMDGLQAWPGKPA